MTVTTDSAAAPIALAQGTKIVFGYTAVTDFASVFVAREEGFFSRRGLDVEPKFVPINSTIPAAVQAGSLQLGWAPPTRSSPLRRSGAAPRGAASRTPSTSPLFSPPGTPAGGGI